MLQHAVCNMEGKRFICCLSFLLLGARVSAMQTLQNIEDLKDIEFGHEYPRHGLLLLYWLAGHISIDGTEDITLHFKPARLDYGFQYYKSTQDGQKTALPHLDKSMDRVYYSLGSLSSETVRTKLPPYVTQDFYNSLENPNRDIDRIVLRVYESRPTRVDKVYITQAMSSEQRSNYDQTKTFEVSFKLLRQVQALQKPLNLVHTLLFDMFGSLNSTMIQSDDPRLALTKEQLVAHLKSNDKRLKTIFEQQGVRWLLSLAGYDIDGRYEVHKQTWQCSAEEPDQDEATGDPKTVCEGQSIVKVEVKSTSDGYTKLTWSGIPKNLLEQHATIVLFTSDTSSQLETFETIRDETSGSAYTFVALKHGIQPRLITYDFGTGHGFIGVRYSVFWRGPQFDSANRVIPTEIKGYNASLQLYTRAGYACARIYIKKSFTNWEDEFYNSWVGFYTKEQDLDRQYEHYQWVSKFEKVEDEANTGDYLIYQYKSVMSIGPGVQARFLFSREPVHSRILLRWYTPTAIARTVPWEKS